mgnify:FL=1
MPLTINEINAMSPEKRAAATRTLEKKIIARFALFFGIKVLVLVGLSLVARAYSKKNA